MAALVRLSQARGEYVAHLAARRLAVSTVENHANTTKHLIRAVGDLPVVKVTGAHVDRMFAANPWHQSTVNSRIGHLRAFFGWCRSRGYLQRDRDPMFGYRSQRVPEQPRTRIPRQEWARLFDACESSTERVVIATGLYLFLRASEQQGIQLRHVNLADGEIDVWRRKTKAWDTMPISAELDGYLREQITWLTSELGADGEAFLMPIRTRRLRHDPVTGQLLRGTAPYDVTRPFSTPHRVVQSVLARCGYPTKHEGEHTLRRSGARAYFDELAGNGYDGALRRVQSMLGHSSSLMTEIYLGLDLDRVKRNDDLRGKPMFTSDATNVVQLRRVGHGEA